MKLTTGCAVEIEGTVVASQGKNQEREIQAKRVIVGAVDDPETYPIAKKRHTFEYLRTLRICDRERTPSAPSRACATRSLKPCTLTFTATASCGSTRRSSQQAIAKVLVSCFASAPSMR